MAKTMSLFVLTIDDVAKLKNVSKKEAYNIMVKYNCFFINNIMCISASEFFKNTNDYNKFKLIKIRQGTRDNEREVKVVKLVPQVYSVPDLAAIFNCSRKCANEIMNKIEGHFYIKGRTYVEKTKFENWMSSMVELTFLENREKIKEVS